MPYRLIGEDFVPPDVVAKVTGRAKFVEDFRVDGMLICRLYVSPLAHGRVTAIRTEAARRMPGVVAILTAADVPAQPAGMKPILTNECIVGLPVVRIVNINQSKLTGEEVLIHVSCFQEKMERKLLVNANGL